jgi:hypothetical protein
MGRGRRSSGSDPPFLVRKQQIERPLEDLRDVAGRNRMAQQALRAPDLVVERLRHRELHRIALGGRLGRARRNSPRGEFGFARRQQRLIATRRFVGCARRQSRIDALLNVA